VIPSPQPARRVPDSARISKRRELMDRLRAAIAAAAEAEPPTPVHPVERPPPARAPRAFVWIGVLLAVIIGCAVVMSTPSDRFFAPPPFATDAHE
jgi:hypothetical protein